MMISIKFDIVIEVEVVKINSREIDLITDTLDIDNSGISEFFCNLAVEPMQYKDIKKNDTKFVETDYYKHIAWLKIEQSDLYDPEYNDNLTDKQLTVLKSDITVINSETINTILAENDDDFACEDCWNHDGSIKYGVAAGGGSLVGGFIIEGLVKGMTSFYSGGLGAKEIKLRHSKTRLYGIAPNKKHDEIDVALKDISIDYHPVSGSDFGDFVIKIPNKEKVYVYHNVYMPNRFYKSIMSAKSGKFDKSIYQSGLDTLPKNTNSGNIEDESDEFDEFDGL